MNWLIFQDADIYTYSKDKNFISCYFSCDMAVCEPDENVSNIYIYIYI